MKIMEFLNPVFKEGENVTVRRGVQWSLVKKDKIEIGEREAYLGKTPVMRFYDITDDMLVNEHDPECRNFYGLMEVMERVYPGFNPREIVTVVHFFFKEVKDINDQGPESTD